MLGLWEMCKASAPGELETTVAEVHVDGTQGLASGGVVTHAGLLVHGARPLIKMHCVNTSCHQNLFGAILQVKEYT